MTYNKFNLTKRYEELINITIKEMWVLSQPNDNNIVRVDEEKYNRNQEIIMVLH